MGGNKRDLVMSLIELAQTSKDADKIIEEHTGYTAISQKMPYLEGMFNVEIVSRSNAPDTDEETILRDDYWAFLSTVVNAKRR